MVAVLMYDILVHFLVTSPENETFLIKKQTFNKGRKMRLKWLKIAV